MVQGTTHGVIHQHTFVERPAVVGARSAHSEETGPPTSHEYRVVAKVTEQHSVIGNPIIRHAPTEIGARSLILRTGHISLPRRRIERPRPVLPSRVPDHRPPVE